MTANQTKYGYGAGTPSRMNGQAADRECRDHSRYDARAEGGTRGEESPIVYIYGDRVCGKNTKQRQLYKRYGTAAGFDRASGYSGPMGGVARKKRYKIMLESIINLIDSIEERRKQDVEAAKRSAIMRKKLIEHRRGFFLALFMIGFLAAFVFLGYNLFFGINSIYAENTVNYTADAVINASGISVGDKLYSFRADEAEDRITFACPYIRSVQVERTVPNRVSLDVESDTAAYCVNVYGEMLVLSEGLRVLGHYDSATHVGLTELHLPEINYAVEGRVITFVEEKEDRFIREILAIVAASGLKDRIGMADLRDPYDVELHCDGMYLLKMGGEKDFAYKLKMAEKTIGDADFRKDTPAHINLGTVGEASVRYDHSLDLTKSS